MGTMGLFCLFRPIGMVFVAVVAYLQSFLNFVVNAGLEKQ